MRKEGFSTGKASMKKIVLENSKFIIFVRLNIKNKSWKSLEGYYQNFAVSDDKVFALDSHSKTLIVREGIFEKGFCSAGKEWKPFATDSEVEISVLKTNNLGCLWALDPQNDVLILSMKG